MFIGSRVEPEWRVEGESHSLANAVCLDMHCVLSWKNNTALEKRLNPRRA